VKPRARRVLAEESAVDDDGVFRQLLGRSLAALLAGAALVALCYFFVDRPVAFFVHDHNLARFSFLAWLTYPPPILQAWAPALLTGLAVRRAWGPFRRWERTLFAACVSLLVAVQFKDSLKYVFGRYWPDTWVHDNPSLIGGGAYGFHPFHEGSAYGSFPSGHAARTLAVVAVVWVAYPRWRWACVAAAAAVAVGLIGMDYHFVGDVIAGGLVGGLVGVYAARFCGLGTESEPAGRAASSAISPPEKGR
jgi:membrane-associated phospholipid phosphatase